MTSPAGTAPLVTVIALCYNHARFLRETLESIRAQTYEAIQWIIVDDASQDGSPAVIRQWVSDRGIDCTLLLHERNMGICASLNDGLSHAKGEYVAIVATDDVWLPEKISLQVAAMEALPSHVGVVYSDAAVVDEQGRALRPSILAWWGFEEPPQGDIFHQLLELNPVPAPTALIKRACFDVVGGYDETLAFEDLDMWLRTSRHFHFAYVGGVVALYRQVGTSMLHVQSSRILESSVRARLKWLGSGPESDRLLRRTVPNSVLTLYRLGDPNVRQHVGVSLRLGPGPRTLALFVLVRLGISHANLRALRNLVPVHREPVSRRREAEPLSGALK